MSNDPLVSALVICYNHERYLLEALESVRNQTYQNIELLVADDCSTDNSSALIKQWIKTNWPECVFVRHSSNMGLCKTLNEILRLSKGKYICGLSTDDTWNKDKIRIQVDRMERQPESVGVMYSDANIISSEGELIPGSFIEMHRLVPIYPSGNINAELWNGNFIPAMTTMIRKSCFEAVGYFDENLFYEDWDMWIRISEIFDFDYYASPLANYRILNTSMVRGSKSKIEAATCDMCQKHLLRPFPSKQTRKAICKVLRTAASEAWRLRHPEHLRYLRMRLRYNPDIGSMMQLLFAACGFSYEFYKRMTGQTQG